MSGSYRFITRANQPSDECSVLVFDCNRKLHLPLCLFAKEASEWIALSSVYVYLYELCRFFTFVATDEWQLRAGVRWDGEPETVRTAVGDYLVQRLRCKVRVDDGYEVVSLTSNTRGTARHFLCAIKFFYRVMRVLGRYPHANPLVDGAAAVDAVEERLREDKRPRMPACSGLSEPQYEEAKRRRRRLSENYFKLAGGDWIPQTIDDPSFPARVLEGGTRVGWQLREITVTHLLFESGARVSEITGLTLGDWLARGLRHEATAFSKGSNRRRVKLVRFSNETAKRLRRYFDTDRRTLDPDNRTLSQYERLAERKLIDPFQVPLFLTTRRTQLTPKLYRDCYWTPACEAVSLVADVHQTRHWYVTQAVRSIYETSQTQAEIKAQLRALIEYMAWSWGWETLECYEHVFDELRHMELQAALHARMEEEVKSYAEGRPSLPSPTFSAPAGGRAVAQPASGGGDDGDDSDFNFLKRIGG